jgi:precorrin-2 dehydrogenase / sirohydrochlorin ferrochelatase
MAYYPVLLDLSGKKVVVIGGGKVAQRKIETLLSYGAVIHIISKDLTSELKYLLEKGEIKLLGDQFNETFIKDAFLLIIATSDKALNRKISSFAREKNILVNAVDQPEECSFIVPSIIKRGDLIVAISTSGKSPALAKKIKETLEGQFGDEYRSFLNLMGKIRKELVSSGMPEEDRNKIFHNLVDSPVLKFLNAGNMAAAAGEMRLILKREFSSDDVSQYIKDE